MALDVKGIVLADNVVQGDEENLFKLFIGEGDGIAFHATGIFAFFNYFGKVFL